MKEYEEFVVSSVPEVCPSFYFVMLNRESFSHFLSIKIIKVMRSYQKLHTKALRQNMFFTVSFTRSAHLHVHCLKVCKVYNIPTSQMKKFNFLEKNILKNDFVHFSEKEIFHLILVLYHILPKRQATIL